MDDLAIMGGTPFISGKIKPFNTIGDDEILAAESVMRSRPLSGFLGGEIRGGYHVQALEDAWSEKFNVKYSIACNSATSGLLAACAAINLNHRDMVLTTPLTMSATAAAPKFFNPKNILFCDVDKDTYCMRGDGLKYSLEFQHSWGITAIITTNLFGHPADLTLMRDAADYCHRRGMPTYLIEDNAQAPFAMEYGRYTGTIGHMGVFSLNVHKHIQCGEGGVVVTNDDDLALRIRHFINHGEMDGDKHIGLNLRMTEITAAIALAQLKKADAIVESRIRQAERLSAATEGFRWITPPHVRKDCRHVYYMWAPKIDVDTFDNLKITREAFSSALRAEGFPIRDGYVEPLYKMKAFQYGTDCPVAENLHYKSLVTFENCAWDLTGEQIIKFRDILGKIDAYMEKKK